MKAFCLFEGEVSPRPEERGSCRICKVKFLWQIKKNMDFLNESKGSNISYILDVSASLSLSNDDDQVNTIGLGVRDALNRAGGLGRVHRNG